MANYTITNARIITGNKKYVECAGLSTDTKPTKDICTGSIAAEVDTQTIYMFDETSGEWKTFAEFGSGS